MKTKFLKSMFKYVLLALVIVFSATSCSKDDDPIDDDPKVLDGLYLVGESTALTELSTNGRLSIALNEVIQEQRSSLFEIYVAVAAGEKGFHIEQVAGSSKFTFGPGSDFAAVSEAELDVEEPKNGLWRGSYTETTTPFVVPEDGLYHVMIDTELEIIAITKVVWGLIGGATPGGWSNSTPMAATFNKEKMDFVVENVVMLKNEFKFRYSNGWKVIIDTDFDLGGGDKGIKVNSNLGGSISALTPGGGNIANDEYGLYKIVLTWELGKGYSATMVKTGDAEPLPEYPEAMYLVGQGTAYGWDAPGSQDNAIMHKIAGGGDNDGIFWKILHLEGGAGFKISAEGWADPNLGFGDVSEFDANGVSVVDEGGNMAVAESNMYMVVLDLRNDMKKVSIKPATVYGIGDAFGAKDWSEKDPASLFTINLANKTLVSPALTANGNIRMYTSHEWIPAWWNAEFNLFNGVIEYRNDGGDQAAVAGTTGQVATLSFDDNTGSIQ